MGIIHCVFIREISEIYIESRFIFQFKKGDIREMDFWPFDRILLRVLQSTGQRSFLTGSK